MKPSCVPFDELVRRVRPSAFARIASEGGPARDFCYLVEGDEAQLVRTEPLADHYDLERWDALARTLRQWRARLTGHEFLVLRIRGEHMFDLGAARVPVSDRPLQFSAP